MALAPLHVIVLVWYCMLWYYIIVLHVLSTPKYDTDRLEWNEDNMRFDTAMYCCEWAGGLLNYGPDLVLPGVEGMSQGTLDLEDTTRTTIAIQFG